MRYLFPSLALLALAPAALVALFAGRPDTPAARFTITDLGAIPKPDDTVNGIPPSDQAPGAVALNDRGQVVGGLGHAFLWDNGRARDLGTLPPTDKGDKQISFAEAVNNRGQVVGMSGSFIAISMTYVDHHGFLFRNNAMRLLTGGEEADQLDPSAINDRGQIVGEDLNAYRGFLYMNGRLIMLGTLSKVPVGNSSVAWSINKLGQVAGATTVPGQAGRPLPTHAFLWQRGGKMRDLGTLPGWVNSYAYGINDRGEIVGWADNTPDYDADNMPAGPQPPPATLAFLWRGGKMTSLGTLPGSRSSEAFGLNNAGAVVGSSGGRAFLWQGGHMQDLNASLPAGTGWVLTTARAINNKGQIAGNGTLHGQPHAFLLTPR